MTCFNDRIFWWNNQQCRGETVELYGVTNNRGSNGVSDSQGFEWFEVSDCEMVEDIQSSGGMKFSCFWFVI